MRADSYELPLVLKDTCTPMGSVLGCGHSRGEISVAAYQKFLLLGILI